MLGEQFMVGSEVCGAVISVRFQVGHWLILTNRITVKPLVAYVDVDSEFKVHNPCIL